ncbi:hypothetical protein BOX15_Mlig019425g1 [Macrostomum lignano]|uniref:Uncharacterized protein n=1 Tax=Macrostomum lignano TaxID=282301 RepID=A0A267E7Z8_9PLAT|nr:hypothetical protein BOX15_Mlig019425g1 [Macrostomum lignano]
MLISKLCYLKVLLALVALGPMTVADATPKSDAPRIYIDTYCMKLAGVNSLVCVVNSLFGCAASSSGDYNKVANCLAGRCGGSAELIVSCLKKP